MKARPIILFAVFVLCIPNMLMADSSDVRVVPSGPYNPNGIGGEQCGAWRLQDWPIVWAFQHHDASLPSAHCSFGPPSGQWQQVFPDVPPDTTAIFVSTVLVTTTGRNAPFCGFRLFAGSEPSTGSPSRFTCQVLGYGSQRSGCSSWIRLNPNDGSFWVRWMRDGVAGACSLGTSLKMQMWSAG